LDYPTTGALLIGKTRSAVSNLNQIFQEKEIDKTYLATAIGKMDFEGVIDSGIDGKPSISRFEVLKTITSERFELLNLVELKPETGRRHQLRKHLASIGNPILGDHDYGIDGLILKGKGLYLHSQSLNFTHPFTKEKLLIEAPTPKKFLKLFT
jgi:23S rRNA pseudouridine1911/1915/1917 synthase